MDTFSGIKPMIWGNIGPKSLPKKGCGPQAWVVFFGAHESGIQTPFLEGLDEVWGEVFPNLQFQPGIALLELGEEPGEEIRGEGGDHPQAERPLKGGSPTPDQKGKPFHLLQNPTGLGHGHAARLGQGPLFSVKKLSP
jgi:hypothetical protein